MLKRLLLIFLLSIAAQAEGPAFVETHRYDAPEALQAVAVDAEHFYAIDNAQIGKYDKRSGEKVGFWKADETTPLIHMNAGVVVDGRLYCAHSSWPHHPWVSSVEIFDCETMQHVDSISLGIRDGALNWVDRRNGEWWAVFVHYQHDVPQHHPQYVGRTSLVRMDDQWRVLEGWVFPPKVLERFRPASNSGGCFGEDGLLYCSGHDHGELYRLDFPKTGSVLRQIDTVPAPIVGQAFSFDPNESGVLYGIDRPKRQVIRMEYKD